MSSDDRLRILLVGGAPRVPVDAVRHLTVAATGRTAAELADRLADLDCDLLLSVDACAHATARRFVTRADLDVAVHSWVAKHPTGLVLLSAAVNDYQLDSLRSHSGSSWATIPPGEKLPSGAQEVRITLRPAAKLIDQLAGWGHRGPLIAFKYEDGDTVCAAAETLRRRVAADLVVANSLDGEVQALVDGTGSVVFPDRPALLAALADRIRGWATGSGSSR